MYNNRGAGDAAGESVEFESSLTHSRNTKSKRWRKTAAAVVLLTLLPNAACQAMYKCADAYGSVAYQETPCAKNTQAQSFRNSDLKAENRPATGNAAANQPANDAPAPNTAQSGGDSAAGSLLPVANEVEVDVPTGGSPPDTSRPDDPRSALMRALLVLSFIALGWAYVSWPFWVANWAKYGGQSYIAWLLISLICTPLLSTLFLRMSDGPNMSPNRGKMWQRFALAGILTSLSMLVLGWDVYRENNAFQHYGQQAFVDPVSEYTIQTATSTDPRTETKTVLSKRYIVEANFETVDGRNIKASRTLPEAQAIKLINGGKVELTYLSNAPEKVRFEGEEHPSPARGVFWSLALLLFSSLAWWVGKKGRATAAEAWKE